MQTRVRYGYDDKDRLVTVTVDLTRQDNCIADGKTYGTSYTYGGDSSDVAAILESGGAHALFTYGQIGGLWALAGMTQVVHGIARKTRYDCGGAAYDCGGAASGAAPGSRTRITDAAGQVTLLESDFAGRVVLHNLQQRAHHQICLRCRKPPALR